MKNMRYENAIYLSKKDFGYLSNRNPLSCLNINEHLSCNSIVGDLPTNLNKQDLLKTIKTAEAFTSEILHIWSEISLETNVSSIDQLKAQSLWHNSLIRVGNKPVYYRSWSVKGVIS